MDAPAFLPSCSITAASVQGTRLTFEDRIDVHVNQNYAYCAVFDGHGGSAAATFAQTRMFDILRKSPDFVSADRRNFADSVGAAFKQLQREMRESAKSWEENSIPRDGTTASLAVLTSNYLMLANVGDSPIFLIFRDENNELQGRLGVKLHSPNFGPDQERIRAAGGIVANFSGSPGVRRKYLLRNQFNGVLRMTRALGNFWMSDPENPKDKGTVIISHMPHCYFYDIHNLAYVIVASDGCRLNADAIATALMEIEAGEKRSDLTNPPNSAHILMALMNKFRPINEHSHDNISIICLRLQHTFSSDSSTISLIDDKHLTPEFVKTDEIIFGLNEATVKVAQTPPIDAYTEFKGPTNVITYG